MNDIIKRSKFILVFVFFFALNLIFIIHNHYYPQAWDALQYQQLASANQYVHKTRLFGYPLFLSLFYSTPKSATAIYGPAICQILLYLLSSMYLSLQFPKNDIKKTVFYSLCGLNIFLYPYLSLTLSDSLPVCTMLVVLSLLFFLFTHKDPENYKIRFFLVGLLIGLSVMLRPAYIFLTICIPVVFLFFLKQQNVKKSLLFTAICCGGFFLAVIPQLLINIIAFNKFTFFPAVSLGSSQIAWGIGSLKYATNVTGIGKPNMHYISPFVHNTIQVQTTMWYIYNPISGLKTIFMHIFGCLDYDYLFPYIYDLKPRYRWILFIYGQAVLYFSFWGYLQTWKALKKKERNPGEFCFYLILLPSIVASWTVLTSIVLPENRFSLPIITILLPYSFYGVYKLFRTRFVISGFVLWLLVAGKLSVFLDSCKTY